MKLIDSTQDRIMISITMMLIISTLQSSIDKMVPKTSYLKMVDIFLIYSFNIVIVIMAVHTYMDMCIHRSCHYSLKFFINFQKTRFFQVQIPKRELGLKN